MKTKRDRRWLHQYQNERTQSRLYAGEGGSSLPSDVLQIVSRLKLAHAQYHVLCHTVHHGVGGKYVSRKDLV